MIKPLLTQRPHVTSGLMQLNNLVCARCLSNFSRSTGMLLLGSITSCGRSYASLGGSLYHFLALMIYQKYYLSAHYVNHLQLPWSTCSQNAQRPVTFTRSRPNIWVFQFDGGSFTVASTSDYSFFLAYSIIRQLGSTHFLRELPYSFGGSA